MYTKGQDLGFVGTRTLYQPRCSSNCFRLDECIFRLRHAAVAYRIYLAFADGYKAKDWDYCSICSRDIVSIPLCGAICTVTLSSLTDQQCMRFKYYASYHKH